MSLEPTHPHATHWLRCRVCGWCLPGGGPSCLGRDAVPAAGAARGSAATRTARLCQRGRLPCTAVGCSRALSLVQPSSQAAQVPACRAQWTAVMWPRDCQGASMLLHLHQEPFLFRVFVSSFCCRAAVGGAALRPTSQGSWQRSALVSFQGSLRVSCLLPALRVAGLHLGTAPLGLQFASNFNTIRLAISVQDPRSKPAPGTAALTCGQSSQHDLGRF